MAPRMGALRRAKRERKARQTTLRLDPRIYKGTLEAAIAESLSFNEFVEDMLSVYAIEDEDGNL